MNPREPRARPPLPLWHTATRKISQPLSMSPFGLDQCRLDPHPDPAICRAFAAFAGSRLRRDLGIDALTVKSTPRISTLPHDRPCEGTGHYPAADIASSFRQA